MPPSHIPPEHRDDVRAFLRDHAIFLSVVSLVAIGGAFAFGASAYLADNSDRQLAYFSGGSSTGGQGLSGSTYSGGAGTSRPAGGTTSSGGTSKSTVSNSNQSGASRSTGPSGSTKTTNSNPSGSSDRGSDPTNTNSGTRVGSTATTKTNTGVNINNQSGTSRGSTNYGTAPTTNVSRTPTSSNGGTTGLRGPLGPGGEATTQAQRTQEKASTLGRTPTATSDADRFKQVADSITRSVNYAKTSVTNTVKSVVSPSIKRDTQYGPGTPGGNTYQNAVSNITQQTNYFSDLNIQPPERNPASAGPNTVGGTPDTPGLAKPTPTRTTTTEDDVLVRPPETVRTPGGKFGISLPTSIQDNKAIPAATEVTEVPVVKMYPTGEKIVTADGREHDKLTADPAKAAPGATPVNVVVEGKVDTATGKKATSFREATPSEVERGYAYQTTNTEAPKSTDAQTSGSPSKVQTTQGSSVSAAKISTLNEKAQEARARVSAASEQQTQVSRDGTTVQNPGDANRTGATQPRDGTASQNPGDANRTPTTQPRDGMTAENPGDSKRSPATAPPGVIGDAKVESGPGRDAGGGTTGEKNQQTQQRPSQTPPASSPNQTRTPSDGGDSRGSTVGQPFMTPEKEAKLAELKRDDDKRIEQAKKIQSQLGGKISLPDAVVVASEISKTTAGEAGLEYDHEDRVAIANSIMNRVKFAAATQEKVEIYKILNAFDANMQRKGTLDSRNYANADVGTRGYEAGSAALDDVLDGQLPASMPEEVRNATHYYTGREPYWADNVTQTTYGPHKFLNPDRGKSLGQIADAKKAIEEGKIKAEEVIYGGTEAKIAKDMRRVAKLRDVDQPLAPSTVVAEQQDVPAPQPTQATPDVVATLIPQGTKIVPTSAPADDGEGEPAENQPDSVDAITRPTGVSLLDPEKVPYSGGAKNSRSFGGPRAGGKLHTGVDIPGAVGTPIRAVMDGVVVRSEGTPNGYGNIVSIQYTDGTTHTMAHNDENKVKKGDTVKKGDVVATIGHSGNANANFPHVHYEVARTEYYDDIRSRPNSGRETDRARLNKERIDPREYFKNLEETMLAGNQTTKQVAETTPKTVIPSSLIKNPGNVRPPANTEEEGDGTPAIVESVVKVEPKVAETKERAARANPAPRVTAGKPGDAEALRESAEEKVNEGTKPRETVENTLKPVLEQTAVTLADAGDMPIKEAAQALEKAYQEIKKANAIDDVSFEEYDQANAANYTYTITVPAGALDPKYIDAFVKDPAVANQIKKELPGPNGLFAKTDVKLGVIVNPKALENPPAPTPVPEKPTPAPQETEEKTTEETPAPTEEPEAVPETPRETPETEQPPVPGETVEENAGTIKDTLEMRDTEGNLLADVKKSPDGTLTLTPNQPKTNNPDGLKVVTIDNQKYTITYRDGRAQRIDEGVVEPYNEDEDTPPIATEEEPSVTKNIAQEVVDKTVKVYRVVTEQVKRIADWITPGGGSEPRENTTGTTSPLR